MTECDLPRCFLLSLRTVILPLVARLLLCKRLALYCYAYICSGLVDAIALLFYGVITDEFCWRWLTFAEFAFKSRCDRDYRCDDLCDLMMPPPLVACEWWLRCDLAVVISYSRASISCSTVVMVPKCFTFNFSRACFNSCTASSISSMNEFIYVLFLS